MEIKKAQVLHTKFGTAKITNNKYYQILSPTKPEYYLKYLHRLIWEDFYKCKIPKNFIIHHKNGIKTDNCILNLQLIKASEHSILHNKGNKLSDETRQKLSKSHMGKKNHFYGKKHTDKSKIKISKNKNTTGYFRVYKSKEKGCKNGFRWVYRYKEQGKQKSIKSVDLKKLEEKVKAKGLKWIKFN